MQNKSGDAVMMSDMLVGWLREIEPPHGHPEGVQAFEIDYLSAETEAAFKAKCRPASH